MLVSLPTTRADKKRETSWPHLVMLTVSASQRLPAMGYLKSSFSRCTAILHPAHHNHYECSLNLTRGCLQVVEHCGWTTRRRDTVRQPGSSRGSEVPEPEQSRGRARRRPYHQATLHACRMPARVRIFAAGVCIDHVCPCTDRVARSGDLNTQ